MLNLSLCTSSDQTVKITDLNSTKQTHAFIDCTVDSSHQINEKDVIIVPIMHLRKLANGIFSFSHLL